LHFQATSQRIKKNYPNYADQNFAQLIDYDEAGLRTNLTKNLGFQLPPFVIKNTDTKGYDLADYLSYGHQKGIFSLDLSKIITTAYHVQTKREFGHGIEIFRFKKTKKSYFNPIFTKKRRKKCKYYPQANKVF